MSASTVRAGAGVSTDALTRGWVPKTAAMSSSKVGGVGVGETGVSFAGTFFKPSNASSSSSTLREALLC
jgi:hypothetical protein